MVAASVSMIRHTRNEEEPAGEIGYNYLLIGAEGILVGVLTGIVGA